MKDKDKKQNKVENDNKQQNVAEEKEADKTCLDIDREGLSDEEYISALEEKLGQAIAEAETCKGLTQRLPQKGCVSGAFSLVSYGTDTDYA